MQTVSKRKGKANKAAKSEETVPSGTIPDMVTATDDRTRWPRDVLYRDAAGAFCEIQIAVRRAQVARSYLLRQHLMPTGFTTWEHTRPKIDHAKIAVDRIRPWLLIGFFGPLVKTDGYGDLDRDSYHDRALRGIEPLINALASIKEDRWVAMNPADRIICAYDALIDHDGNCVVQSLDLAYHEAKGASKLLRLSDREQRIVVGGSYACRRLDAITNKGETGDLIRDERAEHERVLVGLANQLQQFDLAEKIEAAVGNPVIEAGFPKSAIYNRFKHHLIDAIGRISLDQQPAPKESTAPPKVTWTLNYLSQQLRQLAADEPKLIGHIPNPQGGKELMLLHGGNLILEALGAGIFNAGRLSDLATRLAGENDGAKVMAVVIAWLREKKLLLENPNGSIHIYEGVADGLLQAVSIAQASAAGTAPPPPKPLPVVEGEWTEPLSKSELMTRLKLGPRKFETFCKNHPVKQAGNRQLWQMRIDGMDVRTKNMVLGKKV